MPIPAKSASKVTFAILAMLALGAAASALSLPALTHWYPSLQKPHWSLPEGDFVPMWLALSALLGWAMGLLWSQGLQSKSEKIALRWFWAIGVLNLIWCATFFTLESPGWGYILVIVQWLAILGAMWTGSKFNRTGTLLLVPYLVWVTYASTLNFQILTLNVLRTKIEAMDRDPRNQDPNFVEHRNKPTIIPKSTGK